MLSEENYRKEMVNIGVTAKLASPEYITAANLQSSSTETETTQLHTRYQKFLNENSSTPSQRIHQNTGSDDSKTLYQLKTIDKRGFQKVAPSKIEFSLYRTKTNGQSHSRLSSKKHVRTKKSHSSIKRLIQSESKSEEVKPPLAAETSLGGKWRKSLKNLKKKQTEREREKLTSRGFKSPRGFADIYPFDHGCAAYLRTTEYSPQITSELLAQRATDYATRFWAEVFGSLHIGVAFFLTFFIQTYRFVLYCVVKSAVVGFLQMTSDYGIKPLLSVIFNGFVQPVLIFTHNMFSSLRDVLSPISETMNSFLKPIGGLLKSVRLVAVKSNGGRGDLKNV